MQPDSANSQSESNDIVHPEEKILWVHFLEDEHYGRTAVYDSKNKVSVKILPELSIDLSLVFK